MTLRRVLTLTNCTVATSGCVSLVTHGPRVERGVDVGVTTALTVGSKDSTPSRILLFPDFGLRVTGGLADSQHRGIAVQGSVQLSVLTGPTFDLYTQLPSSPESPVAGLGLLVQRVARNTIAPYAMAGLPVAAGRLLYVAHQVAFTSPADTTIPSTIQATTIGLQSTGTRRGTVFLTLVLGHQSSGCARANDWCRALALRTRLLLGASVDGFRFRRPHYTPAAPRAAVPTAATSAAAFPRLPN